MSQDSSVTILDCTLRDGGYYTDWMFDQELVERYLAAMSSSSVDVVELGFRFGESTRFVGPYGYTTDGWLARLPVLSGAKLAVMCNASDLVRNSAPRRFVDERFVQVQNSQVSMVRIAAHFREVEACLPGVERLLELGYGVGFNLMQAGGKLPEEIVKTARMLCGLPLEVVYFADSMGNMNPQSVTVTTQAVSDGWGGAVGFHAHNNMGRALDNALSAMNAGATWLDATVLGMGRGAGNLQLEYLLLELDRLGVRSFNVDDLLSLVLGDFGALQRRHGWGASLFYHLSALYNVHPTYVQEMMSDDRYSDREVVSALELLGASGAAGYSEARLREAVRRSPASAPGSWSAEGWLEDRVVVIIAAGEQGATHLDGILDYIERENAFVLCLNSNSWFPPDRVDAWVACNPDRILLDLGYLRRQPVGIMVVPVQRLGDNVLAALADWTLLDYGLVVREGSFDAGCCTAVVDSSLVAFYALALVNAASARCVNLIGFDGYAEDDPRHTEMEHALSIYRSGGNALDPVALTPTNLSLRTSSVYAPASEE